MHTVKNKMLLNGASIIALTLTRCPDLDLARVKVVSIHAQYIQDYQQCSNYMEARVCWPLTCFDGPSLCKTRGVQRGHPRLP